MHPTQKSCRDDHGQYHHSIRELRLSAASGCHLCCIILSEIESDGGNMIPEDFDLEDFTPWIMMSVDNICQVTPSLDIPGCVMKVVMNAMEIGRVKSLEKYIILQVKAQHQATWLSR